MRAERNKAGSIALLNPRLVVEVSTCTVLGALPAYLFAVNYISESRTLGPAGGVALAATVSGTAFGGIMGGLIGGRLVGTPAGSCCMRAALCAIGLCLVIAGISESWLFLGLCVAVTGVFSGVGRAAGTAIVATAATARSLPRYLSVRQAFVPASLVFAGVGSLASVALIGWRWTFVALGLLTVCSGFATRANIVTAPPRDIVTSPLPLRSIAMAASGIALGLIAEEVLSTYWVVSAVRYGVSVANTALVISLGGLLAATTRVLSGVIASRWTEREFVISGMALVMGSAGLVFMSLGTPLSAFLAILIGFGVGWSWNGVAAAGLVRVCRERVGMAAGIGQVSTQFGNLIAPVLFLQLRGGFGVRIAWLCCAGSCAFGGVSLMLAGCVTTAGEQNWRTSG